MMEDLEYTFLRSQWFPVSRSEDVKDDLPVASRLLDSDLVIMRSGGQVTVADPYCPHRGTNLAMGKLEGGEIECAYHGWRFRASDGRCTLIPSLPPGSNPGTSRLHMYPAVERYGMVWSCLDEPSAPVPTIRDLDSETDWEIRHGEPKDLKAGIRQLTENFRDISHFPFVHAATLGPSLEKVLPRFEIERNGFDLSYAMPINLGGTAFAGNEPVESEQTMYYHLTLPTFARIRTEFAAGGKRLTVQVTTPLDREGELSRLFWFTGIDSIAVNTGASIDEMFDLDDRIYIEDWAIVEHQRPREAPLDLKSQAHTRADAFSIKYRQAYKELMTEFGEHLRKNGGSRIAVGAN